MKVTILQPTRHDGKRYAPGDVADLPKPAAQALIACGSAEEGGKLNKAAQAAQEPATPEEPAADQTAQDPQA
jgi:hypothetical protein